MLLYIKCNKENIDEILKELDKYNIEWIDGNEKPSSYHCPSWHNVQKPKSNHYRKKHSND